MGDGLSPRTGRPKSDNPKVFDVTARIDKDTMERLQTYCKNYNKTITDVVREGIELVLEQKK